MNQIKLTKNKVAQVSDEDYSKISKRRWQYHSKGYAISGGDLMHRVIMEVKKGQYVDHVNGNKLDNRRENLRVCTLSQNNMNRKGYNGKTSKYKGVSRHKQTGKWIACITVKKKQTYIGLFVTQEDAALAYNKKAKSLHGEYATLNEVRCA
jgi:hypothetical protein